jgi:hypothetical protein
MNYLAPEEPRRDTIVFYHAPVETKPESTRNILLDVFWVVDGAIDLPITSDEVARRLRRCEARIWPAPGSPLELRRMQLMRPGIEEALWEYLRETFTPAISEQLRRMPYAQFLETQYWGLVKALLLKARQDRCDSCGSGAPLDVHHTTDENRGSEIWHLDDLKLVCRRCHLWWHHITSI